MKLKIIFKINYVYFIEDVISNSIISFIIIKNRKRNVWNPTILSDVTINDVFLAASFQICGNYID